MKRFLIGLLALASWLPAVPSGAQAPGTLVYQGLLANAAGVPITTATDVTFRIYNVATAGAPLWEETQSITPDADGVFTAELGATVAFPSSLFSGIKLYLGIEVLSEAVEMSPRQLLASTPYAMNVGAGARVGVVDLSGSVVAGPAAATLETITVTAPGPGVLQVSVRASYWYNLDSVVAGSTVGCFDLALCTSPATVAGGPCGSGGPHHNHCYEDADNTSTLNSTHGFTLDRAFPTAGGSQTFYLNASGHTAGIILYGNSAAVVTFFPGASLPVSSPPPPSGESPLQE